LPQVNCGMGEAPSLARRVSMKDNSDQRDESGRRLTRRVDIGEQSRKQNEDRKNDPIPVPCTPVNRCLKNAQIVAQSRAKSRARDALRAAQLEPHIISQQADPIRQVYIRANWKAWRDYPPRFVARRFRPAVHLSPLGSAQGAAIRLCGRDGRRQVLEPGGLATEERSSLVAAGGCL